jgi:hypothetical protein
VRTARRLRAPVAATLLAGMALTGPAVDAAGADAAAGGPSFCERAEQLVDALADIPNVDFDRAMQRRRFFRKLDRIVDGLEAEAPERLESAFLLLRPVYDAVAENPDNLPLLLTEAKARRALNRLARYGRNECDLDLPTF